MRPISIRTEHVPIDFDPSQRSSPTGFSIALQKAVGKGELRLATADPHEQPILDYRYLSEPFDAERLRGAVRLCGGDFGVAGVRAGERCGVSTPTDDQLAGR